MQYALDLSLVSLYFASFVLLSISLAGASYSVCVPDLAWRASLLPRTISQPAGNQARLPMHGAGVNRLGLPPGKQGFIRQPGWQPPRSGASPYEWELTAHGIA